MKQPDEDWPPPEDMIARQLYDLAKRIVASDVSPLSGAIILGFVPNGQPGRIGHAMLAVSYLDPDLLLAGKDQWLANRVRTYADALERCEHRSNQEINAALDRISQDCGEA